MKNLERLFLFTVALIAVPATWTHARWQGPLIAVGIGPFGPVAPYSYPPYSHVYYPSPPIVQFPPMPQQRPEKPSLRPRAGTITIGR
jgi:hypothetical protein